MKLFARATVLALMMVLAVLLAGCGDDNKAPALVLEEFAVGTDDDGCTPADIRLPSGMSRLVITSKSHKNDSYAIETDTGKTIFRRDDLTRGARLVADVTLEPAEYRSVCGKGHVRGSVSVVGDALTGAEADRAKKGDLGPTGATSATGPTGGGATGN